jgi:tetratricopeptide (TPR) repeat protein
VIVRLLAILVLSALQPLWVSAASSPPPADPAAAERLIQEGNYRKALEYFRQALKKPGTSKEEKNQVLARLGLFYQHQVGDYSSARGYYEQVDRREGTPASMVLQKAETAFAELKTMAAEYPRQDRELNRLKRIMLRPGGAASPKARTEVEAAVTALKRLLEEAPDYYRRHEVFFHLGMGRMALGHNWRSLSAFDEAVALKPAMHLYQPVRRLAQTARESGWRDTITTGAWSFTALFGVILLLTTICSRPWQWVSFRHLGIGITVLLLWWGGFQLAFVWIGSHSDAAEIVNRDNFYPNPTYVHTLPDTPGSELASRLFRYGGVAVVGVLFLSVTSARWRHRKVRMVLNLSLAVLLTLSLTGIFYLRHCDTESRLYTHEDGLGGIWRGHLAFRLSDPEPYLLTHPTYYLGLELDSIYDPELLEWLKKYQ